MQNVHTRGNIRGNWPLFGQNAGFLPHLDKAGHICYIFHRFPARSRVCGSKPVFSIPMEHLSKTRVCALCAQRRSASKAPAGFPALLFYYLQTPRRGLPLACKPGRPLFLGSPFGGAGASAPERARLLQTTHIRPLRHCCAMPPLPRGEALAIRAKLLVSPEALPLGELDAKRTERVSL